MNHAIRYLKPILVLVISLSGISGLYGQSGGNPKDRVAYRQAVMETMAWQFHPMLDMMQGKMDYDAKEFQMYAQRLAFLTELSSEGFTPDTKKVRSSVKKALWKQLDDVKQRFDEFQQLSAQLAEVAISGDQEKIKPLFMKVGDSCKSCHDRYEK